MKLKKSIWFTWLKVFFQQPFSLPLQSSLMSWSSYCTFKVNATAKVRIIFLWHNGNCSTSTKFKYIAKCCRGTSFVTIVTRFKTFNLISYIGWILLRQGPVFSKAIGPKWKFYYFSLKWYSAMDRNKAVESRVPGLQN